MHNRARLPFVQIRFKQRKPSGGCRKRVHSDGGAPATAAAAGYAAFVARKSNLEHLRALDMLASALGCRIADLAVSGTKDKLAVTSQLVTARGVEPNAVAAASGALEDQGIVVGPAIKVLRHLRLGEHFGNKFVITVRQLAADSLRASVDASLARIAAGGFANYFGSQRFGGHGSTSSGDRVGRFVLARQWRAAVAALLGPDPAETHGGAQAARSCFAAGVADADLKQALKLMPKHRTRERLMIQALAQFGAGDFGCKKALLAVPRAGRTLWLASYSSMLFNRLVDCRIRAGVDVNTGNTGAVQVGDLVVKAAGEDPAPLTAAEAASGEWALADVLLPVPGFGSGSVYPSNAASGLPGSLLAADGLDEKSFRVNELGVSLKAGYRRLVAVPARLSHTWRRRGMPPDHGGPHDELILDFELVPGAYATMLVRELWCGVE